jgi:hypothetical protein
VILPGICTNCGNERVEGILSPPGEVPFIERVVRGYCPDCDGVRDVLITRVTDRFVDWVALETGDNDGRIRTLLSIFQCAPARGTLPVYVVIDRAVFNPDPLPAVEIISDTDWVRYRGPVVNRGPLAQRVGGISGDVDYAQYTMSDRVHKMLALAKGVLPSGAVVPDERYEDMMRWMFATQPPDGTDGGAEGSL